MIANRNQLWGAAVAQELARSGVRHVCISPGSRSTPLVLAIHAQKGLRVTTHLDERSAAYFALGIGKATRRPAALVCTSGTAAANYLPAVVEANQARVPLLVLTADRPPELRDVGANQSIDQTGLYGTHARWFADAGLPEPNPGRVRHLRALVCRAVAKTVSAPAGPVHINFPFREPLEPTHVPGDVPSDWDQGDVEARDGRGDGPFLRIAASDVSPDPARLDEVAKIINYVQAGLIVVGPRSPDPEFAKNLGDLAAATGYPVLADPLSGVRYATPETCSTYDAWLANPERRSRIMPSIVLRFGSTPTSKHLLHWLKETSATQVVVSEQPTFGEETTRAAYLLPGASASVARELYNRVSRRKPSTFTRSIQELEDKTRALLSKETQKRAFEGAIVRRAINELPDDAQVFVSSSLPVRDLDRFGLTEKRLIVYGNRGASGIDGVTSTALGVAYATGKKVLLVTGDLAFLHDLSALVTRKRLDIPVDILVLDNDGGGIFEFLPIAKHEPPFTELFLTPHGTDLGAIGRALGLKTTRLEASEAVKGGLGLDAAGAGRLIVVATDRKANVRHRRELESLLDGVLASKPEARTRAR